MRYKHNKTSSGEKVQGGVMESDGALRFAEGDQGSRMVLGCELKQREGQM